MFRGVAEMPGTAISPLLAFVGGVPAVDHSLSFKAAKLDRDICPGLDTSSISREIELSGLGRWP